MDHSTTDEQKRIGTIWYVYVCAMIGWLVRVIVTVATDCTYSVLERGGDGHGTTVIL